MGVFLNKFPSPIWMFCTSVASRVNFWPSSLRPKEEDFSTRTNCNSMLLIGAWHLSIMNSPVIGSLRRQTRLSNWPLTLKSGIKSRRDAFKLSGVISKAIGCCVSGGAPMGAESYSTTNSSVSTRSLKKRGLLIRHLMKYFEVRI